MIQSSNGNLFLEPYKGSGKIESKVSSGFATIKQKGELVGLKSVTSSLINLGQSQLLLPAGTTFYFLEEILHASAAAKKLFENSEIDGKFTILSASQSCGWKVPNEANS